MTQAPATDRLVPPTPFVPRRMSFPAPPPTLPRAMTSLIGREREIAAIGELLRGGARSEPVRLVTLTGPGGTGKTRLALHVAAELAGEFADGVCFVSLATVNEPAIVPAAFAAALGAREVADHPAADGVIGVLAGRETLLVLDSFEQVTAAGPFVVDLLTASPRLKVLVTSRETIRISGEHRLAPGRGRGRRSARRRAGRRAGGQRGGPPLRRARCRRRRRLHAVGGERRGHRRDLPPARRPPPCHRAGRGPNRRPPTTGDARPARVERSAADRRPT